MNTEILLYINQTLSHPWLDPFFYWISTKSTFSIPLIAIICITLIVRDRKKGAYIAIGLIVTILVGDALGHFLKSTLGHARPCLALGDVLHVVNGINVKCDTSDDGMPSNHALNFFAAFTFLAVALRSRSVAIFGLSLALLVGISRIYLGEHYPSQVMVGALIGILFGYISAWILRTKFLASGDHATTRR